eukprot:6206246-Pleurochrysis_carterae.AAC.4
MTSFCSPAAARPMLIDVEVTTPFVASVAICPRAPACPEGTQTRLPLGLHRARRASPLRHTR